MHSNRNPSGVRVNLRSPWAYFRGKLTAQTLSVNPGLVLHYDADIGDIVPWSCPALYGVTIHPKHWGQYRQDREFQYPSCACPAEMPAGFPRYTECIVEEELQGRHKGRWVARCAQNRCGWLVSLSDHLDKPGFLTKCYPLREPRAEVDGLMYHRIAVMQATKNVAIFDLLRLDSSKGLTLDELYELFTICNCKRVMTRKAFLGHHDCVHTAIDLTGRDSEDGSVIDLTSEDSDGDMSSIDWEDSVVSGY